MNEIIDQRFVDVSDWLTTISVKHKKWKRDGWEFIGDIRDGIDQFGRTDHAKEDLYQLASDQLDISVKTLKNYVSILRSPVARIAQELDLTFQHADAALGLDAEVAYDVLSQAAENGISVKATRALAWNYGQTAFPVNGKSGLETKIADEEEEDTYPWRFDLGMFAHCKYCYETHDRWELALDNAWVCGKCDHATHDMNMDIREEPLPFADLPEEEEEEKPPYMNDYMYELPAMSKETTKPHVAHNSGNNEWYTPKEYIDAARDVLGAIDLDPASSTEANRVVGASDFFTAEDNGLTQEWIGKVWLNPPYESGLIGEFVKKLGVHYQAGDVPEAIILVNNATETAWFQALARHASAICFPRTRIRFWQPGGTKGEPLQGQALMYLGPDRVKFASVFCNFGMVVKHV